MPESLMEVRSCSVLEGESPLLTLDRLAELLCRTPSGIRKALQDGTDFGTGLKAARVKLGKRVYFRRDIVDGLITSRTGQ